MPLPVPACRLDEERREGKKKKRLDRGRDRDLRCVLAVLLPGIRTHDSDETFQAASGPTDVMLVWAWQDREEDTLQHLLIVPRAAMRHEAEDFFY